MRLSQVVMYVLVPIKSLSGSFPLNINGQKYNDAGVLITDKTCLIMDEVDGMSAGDRGGVGALNALIKKTRVSDSLDLSFIALGWDMGMRLTGWTVHLLNYRSRSYA
jgi:hypothetical protein